MKDWKYHCSVLGVREDAAAKDVRRAYRRLALERHPDKHHNSTRSKEDFQRLHDSYQFLLDALAKGRRGEPAPTIPNVDQEAPTNPGIRMPAVQRNAPPARVGATREPAEGRAALKMWLNAVVAAFAVLTVTTLWEIAHNESAAPTKKVSINLAPPSAYCQIAQEGAEPGHDTLEYAPEPFCRKKCESLAAGSPVNCSWNRVLFHGHAKPVAAPGTVVACQVTTENLSGTPSVNTYEKASESECLRFCVSMGDAYMGSPVRCSVGGKNVFLQERRVAAAEEPASAPPAATYETKHMPEVAPASPQMGSTCFVTAISPGDFNQKSYEGETEQGCEGRCIAIIRAEPLGPEVRCAFGGKQIVTYVPDPMAVYLSKNPGGGIRQGADTVNSCEVYTSEGGVRTKVQTALLSVRGCDDKCHEEFKKSERGSALSCLHAGKEFFHQVAPN